jgi:hypothetical protein
LLDEGLETEAAVQEMVCALKGKAVGSVALLQLDEENQILHLLHKGWSRGLTVWTNDKGEVIFCTRPEPVKEEFEATLKQGGSKRNT